MPNIIEGSHVGSGLRIGIAVSRFNELVTTRMLEGAVETLKAHGTAEGDIEVLRVPGAFELPLAARLLASRCRVDAIICLGAIIKGETTHNEVLAVGIVTAISRLSLEHELPIAFGVLTTETVEQALARAGMGHGNKGAEAALCVLEMANLKRALP